MADEVRRLELPFGDPEGISQMATEAAQLLGYDPPLLDPDHLGHLDPSSSVPDGVHNAAIFLAADFSQFRESVHQELRELRERDDWQVTAAAWLVGRKSGEIRSRAGPLAAALQVNRSQEEILASVRTNPLTVVTGPPGTGKTQLVVNAVANAWLDDETVLLASTNNAAVDVAVERAEQDVLPGLLIRTGNRGIKQQVARSISTARANARRFAGPPIATAAEDLARAYASRSLQLKRDRELDSLDQRLLGKVQERLEARHALVEATLALRRAGAGSMVEGDAAELEKTRASARAAAGELLCAYELQEAFVPFVPRRLRSCTLQVRSDLNAREVESARNRAEKLIGSGPLSFFARRNLRAHLECPRDTSMESIYEWAAVSQEAEAERRRERAANREESELAQRVLEATRGLQETLGVESVPPDDLLNWARWERRLTEIESAFESMRMDHEKRSRKSPASVLEEGRLWSQRSLAAVRSKVATRLATQTGAVPAFSSISMHSVPFARAVEKALKVFQGWACTALSARGSFPLKAGLFDLVIVDEASQCTLADILPLAYRARRIVIAGDPNQLRAITVLGDAHLRQIAMVAGHDEDDLRECGCHHRDGSAYEAFEYAGGTRPYLLDEHYRCHPHIAKWFNEAFYAGDLKVLTNVANTGCRALVWRDVPGDSRRPRGRGGWVNVAQARMVVRVLEELIDPESTIGVVAPYAAQGALIDTLARKAIDESLLGETGFVSGTAHALQGSERDTIVFCSTLTPSMPPNAANWIEQERSLMNVAVSRTKRLLVVVGHPDLDPRRAPTLTSLREHILAVEAGALGGHTAAPVYTHSDAERLLAEAMRRMGMAPLGKLDVEGFELDFALIDGSARLNVEVDGDHHLDLRGQQRRSDLTRDDILRSLGWQVLRIPAWRCHNAPDEAAEEVRSTYERLAASSQE